MGYDAAMGSKQHTETIARGILIQGSRVLMCKNNKGEYYYLPGGHIEFGERACDALSREILEETGLECKVGALILTSEHGFNDGKRDHHEINLVFHMEHLGPTRSPIPAQLPSIESKISFEWIELASLTDADIRPIEMKAWLMSNGAHAPGTESHLVGFSIPLYQG